MRRLELFGAPDTDARRVMRDMQTRAPPWLGGCRLRDFWFDIAPGLETWFQEF